MTRYSDHELEEKITSLRNEITRWAEERDLWFDSGFSTYLKHVGGEPGSPPVVTIVYSGGGLLNIFEEDPDGEFGDFLEKLGYCYENSTRCNIEVYPLSEELCAQFEEYFHWQWVCSLIQDDTADVYEEIYSQFVRNPDQLHHLKWREFEILLHRIFQNHGYKSILGPGQNDGGVDIRLYHQDPIGDVLTVVQAKKYAPHRKINLTDVAAIYGICDVENANRALFVTTSSYLPVAVRFAARTSNNLVLADKSEVVRWCERARRGVIEDKSTLLSLDHVKKLLRDVLEKRDSRIVHTSWGYNMTHNNFALVVKESRHSALLLGLSNKTITDDGYGQMGTEIPIINSTSAHELLNPENVWRAKRIVENGSVSYWDGNNLYFPWDGQAKHFNYID